jgi:hypothetical protein
MFARLKEQQNAERWPPNSLFDPAHVLPCVTIAFRIKNQ